MENKGYDSEDRRESTITLKSMKMYPDAAPVVLTVVPEDADDTSKKSLDGVIISGEDAKSAKLEMETANEPATKPYAGMGKEDLLRFSSTPFWNRFRLVFLLLFWAAWLALLGAVIGLTIVAPRCSDPPTPAWWQKSVVYQIYVRSFFDSDGDGVGDLRGVAEKLSYIKDLRTDAILLSSVYASSAVGHPDYGYEVTNHTDVDNEYGNMADLEHLIQQAHAKDIKVLMDFIPNYTGKDHAWFQQSAGSNNYTNPYWNYYMWGQDGPPPNNWLSYYNGSAWTYEPSRSEWFLHQFLDTQPELNLRSEAVQEELERILRFWLDKGVDGFRVNAVAQLFESTDLRDEPESGSCAPGDVTYNCLNHTKTTSLQEVHDMVVRWRDIIDEYTAKNSSHVRVLLTDADVSLDEALKYYGTSGRGGSQLPFNFALARVSTPCGGFCIRDLVRQWMDNKPSSATADWLTGDQSHSRLSSHLDEVYIGSLTLVKMTLPGTAFLYYGEEIGMKDGSFSVLRNNTYFYQEWYRTPMQWTSRDADAGFMNITTSGSPWLPVNDVINTTNVENQTADEASLLNQVKRLIQLRQDQPSLQYGLIHYGTTNEDIFSYVREFEGKLRVLVVVNFGNKTSVTKFDKIGGESVPSEGDVVFSTPYGSKGGKTDLRKLSLEPGHGVAVTWPYKRP